MYEVFLFAYAVSQSELFHSKDVSQLSKVISLFCKTGKTKMGFLAESFSWLEF